MEPLDWEISTELGNVACKMKVTYAELALDEEDPNERPLQLCIDIANQHFHQNCKMC